LVAVTAGHGGKHPDRGRDFTIANGVQQGGSHAAPIVPLLTGLEWRNDERITLTRIGILGQGDEFRRRNGELFEDVLIVRLAGFLRAHGFQTRGHDFFKSGEVLSKSLQLGGHAEAFSIW